jgi:RNA polymerase sigma-70 factor (ECF subfamily)
MPAMAERVPAAWHDEGVDDHALITAVRSGDPEAFATLVQRETRAVYQAAYRIVGRAADAEDVTQEAFVAAYRAIGTYRGDGSLRGWLLRIAARIAFRRVTQRRDAADLSAIGEPALADRSSEPARAILAAERQRTIRDAIAELPDPYREVVALRFLGDLSLAEVAETTGRPLNTVKTHLRRGLERLRPALAQERELGAADR